MPDISAIILEELRALRATVDELAADTKERLATLEAHDHDINGNGQPGRMRAVENRIAALEHWRFYVFGFAAAVSAVVGIVLRLWLC